MYSYATLPATHFSPEGKAQVRQIVNQFIVRNVKFVKNEYTDRMSSEKKNQVKRFPSFWEPNLLEENSMHKDIFKHMHMEKELIQTKVQYWKGMRNKPKSGI